MAALYLIPNTLGDCELRTVLPEYNRDVIQSIKHFIVEDVRTARRFLKKVDKQIDIDSLTFYTLNQHTAPEAIHGYLRPLREGQDVGVISEAGCPAIADPGADVVSIAQQEGLRVVPMVGPSSILLALMASGFNGQSFAFVGYLPIKPDERIKALKRLEGRAQSESQSQIFIETPYRNMKMLQDICAHCSPNTRLCVAADITLPTEYIRTQRVKDWKRSLPELDKRPCIFILYKG